MKTIISALLFTILLSGCASTNYGYKSDESNKMSQKKETKY